LDATCIPELARVDGKAANGNSHLSSRTRRAGSADPAHGWSVFGA